MFPEGATWGFRDAQELLTSGANVVIHTANELIEVLDQQNVE